MPRYAVDFLAEIQEITSATNFDDCSDSVDLLTNCHNFNAASEEPSEENNVVSALMGNGQCCFKRYPGYQAHRHVVVSRGVQCSEAIIMRNIEVDKDVDSNYLFSPHTTERGDTLPDNCKVDQKLSEPLSSIQQKANLNSSLNFEFLKGEPDIFTPTTEEPPELRKSSKFFKKRYSLDLKKCRKYADDDIDSLSATISNYSLHEKLLNFDINKLIKEKIYEEMDKNNHQHSNMCTTPTPRQRNSSFKGSTDAIRGSTTRTLTCQSNESKVSNRNDEIDIQSSDSSTSFGHYKTQKMEILSKSGDNTEATPVETEKIRNCPQSNINNDILDMASLTIPVSSDKTFHLYRPHQIQSQNVKARILTNDKRGGIEHQQEEKNIKSNSDSKCSSSVTFMKGSEELYNTEKAKSLEFNNLNALRRKQKFLMRHTRNNSKLTNATSSDCPTPMIVQEFSLHSVAADKVDSFHLASKQQSPIEYPQITPRSCTPMFGPGNPQLMSPNNEPSRNNCASRNSNHSERASITPITNTIKMKRTVSFDKNKTVDSLADPKTSNQICTRNTVRAKYCSTKVVKQRFYIPESANIEHILRDPSDRRIKAICDRHNCDIEIYSKIPKSGFLKNIIVLSAPNSENLRKCVRSLDYSMCWCLTAQLP